LAHKYSVLSYSMDHGRTEWLDTKRNPRSTKKTAGHGFQI